MFRLVALCVAAALASARIATENVTLTFSPAFFSGKPLSLMPALYGSARYGDVVTGRVVYSVPKNRQGCHEINAASELQWPVGEDIIVMLDRGDCAFEQKTWHAQQVGAKAVILVDNMREEMLPYMAAGGYAEEITIPSVMLHKEAGDKIKQYMCDCENIGGPPRKGGKAASAVKPPLAVGTKVEVNWQSKGTYYPGKIGSVALLPTAASLGDVVYGITYDDGDEEQAVPRSRIRLVGKGGGGAPAKPKPSGPPDFFKRSVTASLTWGITKERRGNVVKATLWTSADDANSVEFKKQFAAVAHGLGKNLELDVRYFLRSGRATGCQPMGRFNCRGQCTNNGLYCSPDPDNDAFFGLDGEDIVRENMRQMCVLNVSRAEGHPEKWWDYVNAANDACGNFKILPDAQKCRHVAVVEAIMAKVGLDPKKVAQCIAEAGGTDDDGGTNHALEAELRAQTDANVFLQPTLLINGRQYRGNFLCPNPNSLSHCAVLEALCAGFDAAHTNGLCVEEKQPTYEMRYLSKGAGGRRRAATWRTCATARPTSAR